MTTRGERSTCNNYYYNKKEEEREREPFLYSVLMWHGREGILDSFATEDKTAWVGWAGLGWAAGKTRQARQLCGKSENWDGTAAPFVVSDASDK